MKLAAVVAKIKDNKKIVFIIIIVLAAGGWLIWHFGHKTNTPANRSNVTPAQNQIRLFKNDKTPDAMREVATAYEQNGQYNRAKSEWQEIANQTNLTNDWWSLLNICTTYNVNNRSVCISQAAKKLKNKASQMDFQTAYSIASSLEISGNGKMAIPFYEQAIKVYSPPKDNAVSYPSKAQIQGKINAINK